MLFGVTSGQTEPNAFDLSTLERNYENENLLMDTVSRGKLHQVTAVASTVFNNGAQQRLSDSLRDRKNNLVILKTLLRKAAEYGGVHPQSLPLPGGKVRGGPEQKPPERTEAKVRSGGVLCSVTQVT